MEKWMGCSSRVKLGYAFYSMAAASALIKQHVAVFFTTNPQTIEER
jgi:hypothetical protein